MTVLGGTNLERGYGDVRPWRPPFHASPVDRKGPISNKRVSSQDPLLRKFGNFSLYSLNFCPNFSSQAPKFGNFQFTSPQIWKCSVDKPLFQRQYHFASSTLRKSRPHTPTWKKLSAPPPGDSKTFRFVKLSMCKNGRNFQFAKLSPRKIKVFYSIYFFMVVG